MGKSPGRSLEMIRFFIFFLSAFLLGILQSTLVSLIFPPYLKPDLMIALVTFLGISFPLFPGSLLVLFCGLLYDSFSGGVFGLFAFVYLSLFFSLKLIAKFLILGEAVLARVILVAVLACFQAAILIVLPVLLGSGLPIGRPAPGWIWPQIVMTCAACWPLFHLFRKLDLAPAEESSPSIS